MEKVKNIVIFCEIKVSKRVINYTYRECEYPAWENRCFGDPWIGQEAK